MQSHLQTDDLFYNVPLNLFLANVSYFIPPENTRKRKGFLMYSGGIKWEHWPEMS